MYMGKYIHVFKHKKLNFKRQKQNTMIARLNTNDLKLCQHREYLKSML